MIYESTVTSKGTITLPASIRKKLGITEGKKVSIQLRGDAIKIQPQAGWQEVFAAGDELLAKLQKQGKKLPATDTELNKQVEAAKIKEYRQKYGKNS